MSWGEVQELFGMPNLTSQAEPEVSSGPVGVGFEELGEARDTLQRPVAQAPQACTTVGDERPLGTPRPQDLQQEGGGTN